MTLPKELVPAKVGGVDVYIAVQQVPGSEPLTSARSAAAGRMALEAADRIQDVVRDMADRFSGTIAELARQTPQPESLTVEFGITIAAEGSLIIFNGSAEAAVSVTLTYPLNR